MANKEKDQQQAICAHEIAVKIVGSDTTYKEAFEILEMAKRDIERSMIHKKATAVSEIRDKWGNIVKPPEAETTGGKCELTGN